VCASSAGTGDQERVAPSFTPRARRTEPSVPIGSAAGQWRSRSWDDADAPLRNVGRLLRPVATTPRATWRATIGCCTARSRDRDAAELPGRGRQGPAPPDLWVVRWPAEAVSSSISRGRPRWLRSDLFAPSAIGGGPSCAGGASQAGS